MASITDAHLDLVPDDKRKIVKAIVTCKVKFGSFELCLMKNCPDSKLFKLTAELWGKQIHFVNPGGWGNWGGSGFTTVDKQVWTYTTAFTFPDPTPTAVESRKFEESLGYELLDLEIGQDTTWGVLRLLNLFTMMEVLQKTNVVVQSF
jgi:hypothetical protein